jgi:AraC-like DNA-binding protein
VTLEQLYHERPPAPALAAHVGCVWIQSVSPHSLPYAHRTVPNGSIEISCRVGSVPQVSGPQTGPALDVIEPGTTLVGIRFRPGAAPALLGAPADVLVGRSVALQELWGTAATALGERIAGAPSAWDAAAMLEVELTIRLADAAHPDPLVAEAVRRLVPWRTGDVTSLTSSLSISERQLRRRCRDAIGLAPKAVHRILRFQGFLALAHGKEPSGPELALLAADAGYADQSHLTRESLRLSGLTPRALLRESARQCGRTHDHRASFGLLLRERALRPAV